MMKRWMGILCVVLLMVCSAGCGKGRDSRQPVLDQLPVQIAMAWNGNAANQENMQGNVELNKEDLLIEEHTKSGQSAKILQKNAKILPEVVERDAALSEQEGGEALQQEGAGEESPEEEEEERELTEQEVKKLQWSVRGSDNGFFVCTYYRPEEIDWQQVFYNGAGLRVTLSDDQLWQLRDQLRAKRLEEQRQEEELMAILRGEEPLPGFFEEETEEEPFTEEELALSNANLTALTLRSIQSFVKSRTGLDYSEARHPLDWPELSRNLFYFIHNDSNTIRVEFLSASVKGNRYQIYYRRSSRSKEKKPEYVMTAEIEKGKWTFISNLPVDHVEPITLLDVDYYASKEIARIQGVEAFLDIEELPDSAEEFEETTASKQKAKTEQAYYWAVITAREDDTRIVVERSYQGDLLSSLLLEDGYFIPGGEVGSILLQSGEKVGIKVRLEDLPTLRIRASSGSYFGAFAFGSENRLGRNTKEGQPLSTYVVGYDLNGEKRGTKYQDETELLEFLRGTWVFYDSEMGEYTASVVFDGKTMRISTLLDTFVLQISGFDRVYADTQSAPPDLIKLKPGDNDTVTLFTQRYYALRRNVGDYRIKAVQLDGEQMLLLSFENTGKDGLSMLLPGADPLAEEIVLYRFVGAEERTETDGEKG